MIKVIYQLLAGAEPDLQINIILVHTEKYELEELYEEFKESNYESKSPIEYTRFPETTSFANWLINIKGFEEPEIEYFGIREK